MTLTVILLTASILKIVNPKDELMYVFRDPACKLKAGTITVHIENLLPPDPSARVGTLTQGTTTCDVYELVYPGV